MNGLTLIALEIFIPLAGSLLALFLSQLQDNVAARGKTKDWMLFILVFLPTAIISFFLLPYIHDQISYSFTWLPGLQIGIRLNEIVTVFVCIVSNLSALIALYSIIFMSDDSRRTSYWFFFLITQSFMTLGVLANNLLLMFIAFEVVTISTFFLVSHWHRKSGEEGEKASKAAIRFIIINAIADILFVIGFGILIYAFGTFQIQEIFTLWKTQPIHIIGGTSSATRILIEVFVTLGVIVKSAQFPLLFWPISGKNPDNDLAKAPFPVSMLLSTTISFNIGFYILSIFFPIFMKKGYEVATTIPVFNNIPFLLIGWFAIITIIYTVRITLTSKNLTRIALSAVLTQLSFSFLGFSAANQLGYIAAINHLLITIPTMIATFLIFGIIMNSLKFKEISRVSGLKQNYPVLFGMGIAAMVTYSGVFPTSLYFSKDMIFKALVTSDVPSSLFILLIGYIAILGSIFAVGKSFMKMFYGKQDNADYLIRPIKITSYIILGGTLLWGVLAGILFLLVGYPVPTFIAGLMHQQIVLDYHAPIFGNWTISIISILAPIAILAGTFFAYKDGEGKIFDKFRNWKPVVLFKQFYENGMYIDLAYQKSFSWIFGSLGKMTSATRIRSLFAGIMWAVLSVVVMIALLYLVGGT
ncbi:MAG: proton-conducting transporter transmembrane domain-containing protein [Candidatus Heimdallarchaeota archaeon]